MCDSRLAREGARGRLRAYWFAAWQPTLSSAAGEPRWSLLRLRLGRAGGTARVVGTKELVEVLEGQRVVGREFLVVPIVLGRVHSLQEAHGIERKRRRQLPKGDRQQRQLHRAKLVSAVLDVGTERAVVDVKVEDVPWQSGGTRNEHHELLQQQVRLVRDEIGTCTDYMP